MSSKVKVNGQKRPVGEQGTYMHAVTYDAWMTLVSYGSVKIKSY